MTSLLGVQEAFYLKVTNDAALMALVEGVYDHVPEGADYPHLVIGDATEVPRKAMGMRGWRATETVHIWTKQRGFSQALAILKRLDDLFDEQPLDVEGLHTVSVRLEFSQTLKDPDPEIRHIPCRFTITTEEIQP
jgi:hypothetical protein